MGDHKIYREEKRRMTDVYRANRRFERMFPGIAEQNRLRSTDSGEYQAHMRRLSESPVSLDGSIPISGIDERFEVGPNGERICVRAELVQYNPDGSEKSRKVIYDNPQSVSP